MGIEPVFLLYISRSGSTFFANQIAQRSSDVVVLPELDVVNLLCDVGEVQLQSMSSLEIGRLIELDKRYQQMGIPLGDLQIQIDQRRTRGVKDVLSVIGQLYAERCGKHAARFALFQRGNIISVADQLCSLSATPTRFIYLCRDPRGCLNSIQGVRRSQTSRYDRRRIGRCDAVGIAKAWGHYVRNARQLGDCATASVLEIKYEQLCQDLSSELQRCANFLGVSLDSEIRRPASENVVANDAHEIHENIDEPVMMSRCDAWRRELSDRDIALVESIAAEEMNRQGYAVSSSSRNGFGKLQLVIALIMSSVITASIRLRTFLRACASPTRFRLHWRHYRRRLESARNI